MDKQMQVILRQFIQLFELKAFRAEVESKDAGWTDERAKEYFVMGFKAAMRSACLSIKEALGEDKKKK